MSTPVEERATTDAAPHAQLDGPAADRICHELRGPIAVIQAYAELLADGIAGTLNTEQSDYVRVIDEAARSLARRIEELHESHRALTEGLSPRWEACDLEQLIFDIAREYEQESPPGAVRLECRSDGTLVHPKTDRQLLRSALRRAIDNAVVHAGADAAIFVELRETCSGAEVAVRDTGPGLAPDDIDRLFLAFTRGDARVGTKARGFGLGLPVCRAIMRSLGGDVRAATRPERGAELVFDMPFVQHGEDVDDDVSVAGFVRHRHLERQNITP